LAATRTKYRFTPEGYVFSGVPKGGNGLGGTVAFSVTAIGIGLPLLTRIENITSGPPQQMIGTNKTTATAAYTHFGIPFLARR
jgi:hypothetical protein